MSRASPQGYDAGVSPQGYDAGASRRLTGRGRSSPGVATDRDTNVSSLCARFSS
jgi:hypothetical protein